MQTLRYTSAEACCPSRPDNRRDTARALAEEKIVELDRRIADLRSIRDSLRRLAATCAKPRSSRDCALLASLEHAAAETSEGLR